jgi:hypothetical protein
MASNYNYKSTLSYQYHCLMEPIPFSIFVGSGFTAYNALSSWSDAPSTSRHRRLQRLPTAIESPLWKRAGTAIGTIYLYYALQCPMEAVHGRASSLHNGLSAFTMSYIALSQQWIGVPFVPSYYLMNIPFFTRTLLGSSIYGSMAFVLASVWGGKRV